MLVPNRILAQLLLESNRSMHFAAPPCYLGVMVDRVQRQLLAQFVALPAVVGYGLTKD
jgi:hypothetical protein